MPTPTPTPSPTPTLTPTPTPEPFGLMFLRQEPPTPVVGRRSREDLIPYVFLVTNFDLTAETIDLQAAYEGPGLGWTHRPAQELITYMHPSVESGTYTVALRLPDGQRAEAVLRHVATKQLSPLPPGEFYDFPDDVAPLLTQLPIGDTLRLYVQPDGCPSERYPPGYWGSLGRECEDQGGTAQNAADYIYTPKNEVLLRVPPSEYASQFGRYALVKVLAHEICHAHQLRMIVEAGLGDPALQPPGLKRLWDQTPEGQAFFDATGWRREGDDFVGAEDEPEGYEVPKWNPSSPATEDFAVVCAFWYMDRDRLRETAPRRFAFAQEWLAQWVPDAHEVDTSGPAINARLIRPFGVALDDAGNLYIADRDDPRIRKVDAGGTITTVAGIRTRGFSGDGGPATSAQINSPRGVALDGAGNLYIVDTGNNRIRKVDTSGIITTVAGTGDAGFSGDGGPATSARLSGPRGVALDDAGNLYIADRDNNRIRKVDTSGTITTVAGTGDAGFSGDGGPALSATLNGPSGVALDGAGNLYIAEFGNSRIRKVDTSGTITTVAGTGSTN